MGQVVDWGTITGLAATIAASLSAWNSRRTKKVVGAPQANGDPAPTLSQIIAEVQKLLIEMLDFEAYSHVRNHDLLNNEAVIYMMVAEIARAQNIDIPSREAILDALATRMNRASTAGGRRWNDPPSATSSGGLAGE